ncbi:hypothetical protein WJX72_005661 [[Myrmecia] bisecta]|uniref:J domain-containing protein n=1 Tax=[Myrmecia] bisecta TaxID=41462 RepID=A0AAW1Q414_9CHLO
MQVVSNYVNPHRTLGVEEGATEQQIKRAYRKLALKLHPDINSSPAAHVEFMQMQHAYETLIGRGRGKELDYEHRQHGNSWDFHDWYWKFSTSQRPGQAGAAGQAQPSSREQALQVRLDRLASHFRIASLRDDHTDAFAAASGSFREADQHLGSWRASHGGLGMRPNPGHGSSPYQHSQHSTAARTAVLEREVQQHNTDATSLEDVVERLESRFSSSDNTAVGDEPADAGPPESTAQHSAADAGMGSAQGPWWEEVVTDGSASTLRAGGEGEARVQSQLMGLKRRAALRKKGQ